MVKTAFTGRVNGLVRVPLSESVTVTEKPMEFVLDGVPVSTPPELREKPAGKPEADQK